MSGYAPSELAASPLNAAAAGGPHISRRRDFLLGLAGTISYMGSSFAADAPYPAKPVRMVSIAAPGTGMDDFCRLLAPYLSTELGQSFYIDNRPGAASAIAAEIVAAAPPDGYTLLLAAGSTITGNPAFFKKLSYRPLEDFVHVARLVATPTILIVSADSKYRTLADVVKESKTRPAGISYATTSSAFRAIMGAVTSATGMNGVDVPYKAWNMVLPDLLSGRIDMASQEIGSIHPLIKAGKVRALGIGLTERSPLLPDVPTFAEAGVGEAQVATWFGLSAPKGTPQAIVDKIAGTCIKFLQTAEAKRYFAERGAVPFPDQGESFKRFIERDSAQWERLVQKAGIEKQ